MIIQEIISITSKINLMKVNCYLLKLNDGFILIDTGWSKCRLKIENELKDAGCHEGNLNLIILTHGDFDHIGNAKYFKDKYKTKIAMHKDDLGMAERGDMFWNRKTGNFVMKFLAGLMFKLKKNDMFTPDIFLKEGDGLNEYGFNAKVISIPGHSMGSIGLLTENNDLFCGDIMECYKKPSIGAIIDNKDEANKSIERLKKLDIRIVYPGHVKSFLMSELK